MTRIILSGIVGLILATILVQLDAPWWYVMMACFAVGLVIGLAPPRSKRRRTDQS